MKGMRRASIGFEQSWSSLRTSSPVALSRVPPRCFAAQSYSNEAEFITTPIYYVNARPHLGHAYSSLIADARSRWRKLRGSKVLLSTGTDEHGTKIRDAALALARAKDEITCGDLDFLSSATVNVQLRG